AFYLRFGDLKKCSTAPGGGNWPERLAVSVQKGVRKPGLEPGWIAPPAPKAGASTSSATFAFLKDTTPVDPLLVGRDDCVTDQGNSAVSENTAVSYFCMSKY